VSIADLDEVLWLVPMGTQALVRFALGRRRTWRPSTGPRGLIPALPGIFQLDPDPFYERFTKLAVVYAIVFRFCSMVVAASGAGGCAIGRWT
jgi:hypothetical protein